MLLSIPRSRGGRPVVPMSSSSLLVVLLLLLAGPWVVFARSLPLLRWGSMYSPVTPEFAYVQPPHTGTGTVFNQVKLDTQLRRSVDDPARPADRPNLLGLHGFYLGPPHAADNEAILARVRADVDANRHRTVQQLVALVGEAEWDRLVTFSFVRSPHERVLSAFAYSLVLQGAHDQLYNMSTSASIRAFRAWLQSPDIDDRLRYLTSQCDMLLKIDGSLGVDFVGHTQTLQQDYNVVCRQHLGVAPGVFNMTHCIRSCPEANKRRLFGAAQQDWTPKARGPWQLHYDPPAWDFVVRKYSCDLDMWFPHLRPFRAQDLHGARGQGE